MTGTETVRFDHEALESFVWSVLDWMGVDDTAASTVAEALVRADLGGVDSHGVAFPDPR